jgi:type VI secretion system protein ImpF
MVKISPPLSSSSLLDRLTDSDPEGIASLTLSAGEMPLENPSQAILRDLQWLFNTFSLDSVCDLSCWPNVQRSGLNFGVSSILGSERSGLNLQSLEASITEAIVRFEPRLRRDSLLVTAFLHDARSREVCVLIEAEYWRSDRWLPLELQTWVDRESGRFEVTNALTLESRIARHHRA